MPAPLPVADQWYQVIPVNDRLQVITEPHVHPFLRANIWHVRGSRRDLVVDAGLGVLPLRGAVPQLFERDPALVLTHATWTTWGAPTSSRAATPTSPNLRGPHPPAACGP